MTCSLRAGRLLAFMLLWLNWANALAGLDEGLAALSKRDYAAAAKELLPLAERGNPEAQYRIGRMLEFGAGFPVDKAQGIAWYRKAAAQGHAAAQAELGALYAAGDGVPKDDTQAVAWFQKAAAQGNASAQFNLGLMLAKGAGIRRDDAQALAWFRKSAAQGFAPALSKVGVAYEHGEAGVAKDPVLAFTYYAIAARGGSADHAAQRDAMAAQVAPAQKQQALAVATAWSVGQALPASVAGADAQTSAGADALAKDRCAATGEMGGARFATTHCAVSLLQDQHSVAIWFNEDPLTAQEVDGFQTSSYADGTKAGKPRTMLIVMFCPGGGQGVASPAAVKSIDINTNHGRAPLEGIQWVVEAGKDFKVERMTGDVRPGGRLSGKVSGRRDRTTFTLDFDVTLPAKDAAAGLSCGK